MNRSIALGAVAVVLFVVLAVLLFPKPDTGGRLEGADPARAAAEQARRPDRARTPAARVPGEPPGPGDVERAEVSPELQQQRAWRARPAAAYATRLLAPVSAIRYLLMKEGTPEARTLADQLATGVMNDLRAVRASDLDDPLTELEPKIEAVVTQVSASAWADDPTVVASLAKITAQLAEFERVKAGEPMPEPTPPKGEAVDPE